MQASWAHTVRKATSLLGFIYEQDHKIVLLYKPFRQVLQNYSKSIGVLYQGGKADGA